MIYLMYVRVGVRSYRLYRLSRGYWRRRTRRRGLYVSQVTLKFRLAESENQGEEPIEDSA